MRNAVKKRGGEYSSAIFPIGKTLVQTENSRITNKIWSIKIPTNIQEN
jgi:hypothetical protein